MQQACLVTNQLNVRWLVCAKVMRRVVVTNQHTGVCWSATIRPGEVANNRHTSPDDSFHPAAATEEQVRLVLYDTFRGRLCDGDLCLLHLWRSCDCACDVAVLWCCQWHCGGWYCMWYGVAGMVCGIVCVVGW